MIPKNRDCDEEELRHDTRQLRAGAGFRAAGLGVLEFRASA